MIFTLESYWFLLKGPSRVHRAVTVFGVGLRAVSLLTAQVSSHIAQRSYCLQTSADCHQSRRAYSMTRTAPHVTRDGRMINRVCEHVNRRAAVARKTRSEIPFEVPFATMTAGSLSHALYNPVSTLDTRFICYHLGGLIERRRSRWFPSQSEICVVTTVLP